jgi:hypothetical protein
MLFKRFGLVNVRRGGNITVSREAETLSDITPHHPRDFLPYVQYRQLVFS